MKPRTLVVMIEIENCTIPVNDVKSYAKNFVIDSEEGRVIQCQVNVVDATKPRKTRKSK